MEDVITDSATGGYESRIAMAASPEAVFDALTTLEGLAGWWSPVSGCGNAGGQLRLAHRHDEPLVLAVDAADRPQRVTWTVLDYPLNPEWAGTRISFALRPRDAGTLLEFRHEGLTPQLECYDHCSRGWDHFLPSLRAYAETGTGSPLS